MDRVKSKKEIEKLRKEINHHDYRYYALDQPEISDKEYDELISKLKVLEKKFPDLITSDSPTQRVSGEVLKGFKTVKHITKMYSLDNSYSVEEIKDWQTRIKKLLPNTKIEYVTELKMDGVSAALRYKKGNFSLGATRGDGITGEDITANLKTIRAIPLSLLEKSIPDFLEVRGEVYMDKNDFEALNKQKSRKKEALFANPRNATSGSLKLLDTNITAKRKLNFFTH